MVNQYSKNQFHLVDGHFFVWSMTIVNHLKRGCNEMSWDTEPTICVGLIYSEVSTYVYIYIHIGRPWLFQQEHDLLLWGFPIYLNLRMYNMEIQFEIKHAGNIVRHSVMQKPRFVNQHGKNGMDRLQYQRYKVRPHGKLS